MQAGISTIGGKWDDLEILRVGLPLLFAVFPSISLSGIPDCDADHAVGKSTLVVKLGIRPVAVMASASALAAFLLVFSMA